MPNSDDRIIVRNRDSRVPIEQYARLPRLPLIVALENLRSSFNVGAAFRSCECARVEQLITCGITAHPPADKVFKTSMGTCEFVPHEHFDSAGDALRRIKERDIPVFALETTSHSRKIYEIEFPRPCCLFLGNEALGLSDEVLHSADYLAEIPLLGYKNSLNVSVALGITLFEVLRQWGEVS